MKCPSSFQKLHQTKIEILLWYPGWWCPILTIAFSILQTLSTDDGCHVTRLWLFSTFRQTPIFRSTSSDLYGLKSPCSIHKVESVTTLYSSCKEEVLLWQRRAWVLLWTPYFYPLHIKVHSVSIILLTSYLAPHSVTLFWETLEPYTRWIYKKIKEKNKGWIDWVCVCMFSTFALS